MCVFCVCVCECVCGPGGADRASLGVLGGLALCVSGGAATAWHRCELRTAPLWSTMTKITISFPVLGEGTPPKNAIPAFSLVCAQG